MSSVSPPWIDADVFEYIAQRSQQPDDIQRDLIAETAAALGGRARMQISPVQGSLMHLLVKLTGAREVVEVGTFTGYSALCIARALPDGGRLLCCDVSEEWTAMGRRAWERAGVSHKIELRIAPAVDTLRALANDETIDLAFIDADKANYGAYYAELLARLRPNGLILIDNTLWGGAVVREPADDDTDTIALRALNDTIAADNRVDSFILPIGDGLTMVRKH